MVSSMLPSLAMMRGGVAEVDPFLVSRNTLGNENRKLKICKVKCQIVVAEKQWWFALGNAEVE